jgi:uncharacterized Zn-binding protein involved in type VI secretion
MARKIARVGDTGSHGGAIVTVSSNTKIDGKKIALDGDIYPCPTHGNKAIIGTGGLKIDGKRVVCHGDVTACGATIQVVGANTKTT